MPIPEPPASWADLRHAAEVIAILSSTAVAGLTYCLHRLRQPLLDLSARLARHEQEEDAPARAAIQQLNRDVRGGFQRVELELGRQRDTLVEHGQHLAALDERTEVLLLRWP